MLFLSLLPEPCSTIPINRSPGTDMGRDLFWEGSIFRCHMFLLKRSSQSTSLVCVSICLLQIPSQIISNTCKSYSVSSTPDSTSPSPGQEVRSHRNKPHIWAALNCAPGPCPAATLTFTHAMFSFIPGLHACPSLCLRLFSSF